MACDLGQRVTNAFTEFCVTIGQFDWYLLPIGTLKTFSMIMINTQQPVSVCVFGSVTFNREAFQIVISIKNNIKYDESQYLNLKINLAFLSDY